MNLHLVLVRTESASNIGATARAMANMGGDRLILIDPQCEVHSEPARQMAAGAQDKLREAIVYSSWEKFFAAEGDGVRIALSRRGGRNRKVSALEPTLAELPMPSQPALGVNLYLILGPEADGLDADDLAFANYVCHLPVYGEFASLNLSQASMLALFITRSKFKPAELPKQTTGEIAPSVRPMYFPDHLIKDWLTAMGFDVSARRASAYLTLRRLFLANLPTRHEIQVLEAILQQNIRKLREKRNSEGVEESVGFTAEELAHDLGEIPV